MYSIHEEFAAMDVHARAGRARGGKLGMKRARTLEHHDVRSAKTESGSGDRRAALITAIVIVGLGSSCSVR